MATELTDAQFESLPAVDREEGLSMGGLDLFAIQRSRFALRLYAALGFREVRRERVSDLLEMVYLRKVVRSDDVAG